MDDLVIDVTIAHNRHNEKVRPCIFTGQRSGAWGQTPNLRPAANSDGRRNATCPKGQPGRLKNALIQVLLRMDVLPWDEKVATGYGEFCSTLEFQGINLSDFDMMIAAHAVALDATLVSRDKAFGQVDDRLKLEVWSLSPDLRSARCPFRCQLPAHPALSVPKPHLFL